MKRRLVVALALLLTGAAATARAQGNIDFAKLEIQTVKITDGVYAEPQDTLLTSRALDYLAQGPADVVDLIGHICNLPKAPRIVAEHMAHAMFAGRRGGERVSDDEPSP